MSAVDQINRYVQIVCKRLEEGKVIPFLGAGASLCERPPESDWRQGYLPSGCASWPPYFAESYAYPEEEPLDLVRVSQYVELAAGDAALYEELHVDLRRHVPAEQASPPARRVPGDASEHETARRPASS